MTTCAIIHQDEKKEESFYAHCIPILGKYCFGFIDWFSWRFIHIDNDRLPPLHLNGIFFSRGQPCPGAGVKFHTWFFQTSKTMLLLFSD